MWWCSFGDPIHFAWIRRHVARCLKPPESFQWLQAVAKQWPDLLDQSADLLAEEGEEVQDEEILEEQEYEYDEEFEEVECTEQAIDGVLYLVDPTGKVYSADEGNCFLGKLTGGVIDFDAVDSSDEDEPQDVTHKHEVLNGEVKIQTKKQRIQ